MEKKKKKSQKIHGMGWGEVGLLIDSLVTNYLEPYVDENPKTKLQSIVQLPGASELM